MDKPKGKPRGGSRKGIPNKATTNAREAIAAFVEGNSPRLNELLDQIEQENGPLAAFKCIMDVAEYHIPKLARTEHAGDKDNPVKIDIGWEK